MTEAGGDDARVQAVGADAAAIEAACEFVGEENIGELGLAVDAIAAEPLLATDVIEVDARADMCTRADADDASAIASVAALTISVSTSTPSCLPNLPWAQPTMQAVMMNLRDVAVSE